MGEAIEIQVFGRYTLAFTGVSPRFVIANSALVNADTFTTRRALRRAATSKTVLASTSAEVACGAAEARTQPLQ